MEIYVTTQVRQDVNENHGKVITLHHFMYFWYILWVTLHIPIKISKGKKDLGIQILLEVEVCEN